METCKYLCLLLWVVAEPVPRCLHWTRRMKIWYLLKNLEVRCTYIFNFGTFVGIVSQVIGISRPFILVRKPSKPTSLSSLWTASGSFCRGVFWFTWRYSEVEAWFFFSLEHFFKWRWPSIMQRHMPRSITQISSTNIYYSSLVSSKLDIMSLRYLQSIIRKNNFSSSQQHVAMTLPRPTWSPQAWAKKW